MSKRLNGNVVPPETMVLAALKRRRGSAGDVQRRMLHKFRRRISRPRAAALLYQLEAWGLVERDLKPSAVGGRPFVVFSPTPEGMAEIQRSQTLARRLADV